MTILTDNDLNQAQLLRGLSVQSVTAAERSARTRKSHFRSDFTAEVTEGRQSDEAGAGKVRQSNPN